MSDSAGPYQLDELPRVGPAAVTMGVFDGLHVGHAALMVATRAAAEAFDVESVALVFDRPDERQVVFERMDWTQPNRRGYFERNRAFIAASKNSSPS